jgi:predicted NBD/HSP70 family sugar kinase/predicted transcriptional regulator
MNEWELNDLLREGNSDDPVARIVRALSESGSLSAAEISRATGLAKSTVSTALGELRRAHMVVDARPAQEGRRTRGRPGSMLMLNPSAGVCIGVQVGADFLRVAAADVSHTILAERMREMPGGYEPNVAAEATAAMIDDLCRRGAMRRESLLGVGLAIPGPVRPDTGQALRGSMVPGWARINLREAFEPVVGLPIFADNEANCSAIAEMMWGAAAGYDDFLFFKIDIGVGGAIVVNRRVMTGRAGGAGEFGHIVIDPMGDLCACGNRGCLELYGGFGAVLRHAAPLLGERASLHDLIAKAKAGDTGCQRLIADAGYAAGRGLAIVSTAINPTLIVVGGRAVAAGSLLLDALREAYDRDVLIKNKLWPEIATPIVPGALLNDDSTLGAIGLVLRHHGRLREE